MSSVFRCADGIGNTTHVVEFYPLAAQATVAHLDRASEFFEVALGFPVRSRSAVAAELDNGSMVIRLVAGPHNSKLTLVLMAQNLREAAQALLAHPEVTSLREEDWVSPCRKETGVCYDGWLELVLARDYNEDELGLSPELPTDLEWDAAALALMHSLVARVPLPYRAGARLKSTRGAEAFTLEKGEVVVQPFEAVRGMVRATPLFQHQALWRALSELGQDPQRWAPELVEELRI